MSLLGMQDIALSKLRLARSSSTPLGQLLRYCQDLKPNLKNYFKLILIGVLSGFSDGEAKALVSRKVLFLACLLAEQLTEVIRLHC